MKKALIVLIMLFTLTACSQAGSSPSSSTSDSIESTQSTTPEATEDIQPEAPEASFDLDGYKKLVSECRTDVNTAGIVVANVGTYETTYWKTLGRLSDKMVDAAFEWLSENSEESLGTVETRDTVDTAYNNIRETYKSIILIEIEGKEAEEIDKSFRELCDSYFEMYQLVTEPSGTLSGFAESLSGLMGDFSVADENLSLFLDE